VGGWGGYCGELLVFSRHLNIPLLL
jgi:hypothetical protein